MQSEYSQNSYSADYAILELDDRANWAAAQANYRRLVHLWHPDKFEDRPRERDSAQRQFIALNKAYNSLRSYYKLKHRLPHEPLPKPNARAPGDSQEVTIDMGPTTSDVKPTGPDSSRFSSRKSSRKSSDNPNFIVGSTRRKSQSVPHWRKSQARLFWAALGCTLLLATVAFFIVQDRKANQAMAQHGREVVKHSAPSDFMPSAAEIRRSQTRGAFVKPTK